MQTGVPLKKNMSLMKNRSTNFTSPTVPRGISIQSEADFLRSLKVGLKLLIQADVV